MANQYDAFNEVERFITEYRSADLNQRADMGKTAIAELEAFISGEAELEVNSADFRNAMADLILEFMTDERGELTEAGNKAYDKVLELEQSDPIVIAANKKIKNAAIANLLSSMLSPANAGKFKEEQTDSGYEFSNKPKIVQINQSRYSQIKEILDNFKFSQDLLRDLKDVKLKVATGYDVIPELDYELVERNNDETFELHDFSRYSSNFQKGAQAAKEAFNKVIQNAKNSVLREFSANDGFLYQGDIHAAVEDALKTRLKLLMTIKDANDIAHAGKSETEIQEGVQKDLSDENLKCVIPEEIIDDSNNADVIEAANFVDEIKEGSPEVAQQITDDIIQPYIDEYRVEPEKESVEEESPELKKARQKVENLRTQLDAKRNGLVDDSESDAVKNARAKLDSANQKLENIRNRSDEQKKPESAAKIGEQKPTSIGARIGKNAASAALVSFGITATGHIAEMATGVGGVRAAVAGGLGITMGLVSVGVQIRKWHRYQKAQDLPTGFSAMMNDANLRNAIGPTLLSGCAFGAAMTGYTGVATLLGGAAITWGGAAAAGKNRKDAIEAGKKKWQANLIGGGSFLAVFAAGFAGKLAANALFDTNFYTPGKPESKTAGTADEIINKTGTRDYIGLTNDAAARIENIANQWGITDDFKASVAAYNAANPGANIDANAAWVLAGDAGMKTNDNMTLWSSENGTINSGGHHTVMTQAWADKYGVDVESINSLKSGEVNNDFFNAYKEVAPLISEHNQVGEMPVVRPDNMPVMETYADGSNSAFEAKTESYTYQETVTGTKEIKVPGTDSKWYLPALGMFGMLADRIPAVTNLKNHVSKTREEKNAQQEIQNARKQLDKALKQNGKSKDIKEISNLEKQIKDAQAAVAKLEKKENKKETPVVSESQVDKVLNKLGVDKLKLNPVGKIKLAQLKKYLNQVMPSDFLDNAELGETEGNLGLEYKGKLGIFLWKDGDITTEFNTEYGTHMKQFGLKTVRIWKDTYLDHNDEEIKNPPKGNSSAVGKPQEEKPGKENKKETTIVSESQVDKVLNKLGVDKLKLNFVGKMKLAKLKAYLKQAMPSDFLDNAEFGDDEESYSLIYRKFSIYFWKKKESVSTRAKTEYGRHWKEFGLKDIYNYLDAYYDNNGKEIKKPSKNMNVPNNGNPGR